ncbi:MAG: flavodoxin domain-containing protein [bacterium]|nr:flavodoxin domain-containing protein [bacterium]
MEHHRILVTYATRAGSTQEVAEFIGKVLREAGEDVDVCPVESVKKLDGYQAVVLGSGIRNGNVFPEALRFARRFRADLAQKAAAYFAVCMTMREDTPENRAKVANYLVTLEDIRPSFSKAIFAGKVEFARLEPLWRFLFSHSKDPALKEGDWRDWDAIHTWAKSLVPQLAETV